MSDWAGHPSPWVHVCRPMGRCSHSRGWSTDCHRSGSCSCSSLVVFEAIDQKMFNASNGELLPVFSKVEPFRAQMREQNANFLRHLEEVARQFPDADTRLAQLREQFRAMAAAKKTSQSQGDLNKSKGVT